MQTYINAKELAALRGVSAQTAINWARDGYPLDNGEKVPIPGADKSGRKWIFDKTKTIRFFERLKEERWLTFTSLSTQTQKPKRRSNLKSGIIGSGLKVKATGEQLMKRLNLPH